MARSVWKGPMVDGYLLDKAEAARQSTRNEVIRTWSRRSTILPQFVGLTFGVYNGHKFIPVNVTEEMVGTSSASSRPPGPSTAFRRRQEVFEVGRAMSKKPNERREAKTSQVGPARAARQPAQAQPGRADPRHGRRQGAQRAASRASASPSTCARRCSRRSPTPRTTTSSMSTGSSCRRPASARAS